MLIFAFGSVWGSIGLPAAIKPKMGTSIAFSEAKSTVLSTSSNERFLPGRLFMIPLC